MATFSAIYNMIQDIAMCASYTREINIALKATLRWG